jgi:hypothetical protein
MNKLGLPVCDQYNYELFNNFIYIAGLINKRYYCRYKKSNNIHIILGISLSRKNKK